MTSRRLHDLNSLSAQFPDQFDYLLSGRGHVKFIPEDELVGVVDQLNGVLERLDHTDGSFRERFSVFQEICGSRAILPASYELCDILSYESEQPIASGGFCIIFKGKAVAGDVCVKRIRICSADDVDQLKRSFCGEAALWKHLDHPNIVPFIGVTLEPLQLLSEWMPGGELREYLKSNPKADLMGLLLGVVEGLAYLHLCGVIHGDLKGPNIMVDGSGNARITDFGLSSFAQSSRSPKNIPNADCHTARWCAPELLMSDDPASEESDVFSFGMVVIEVYTGKAPFSKWNTERVITKIVMGGIPERPTHPGFTNPLWELTRWCLKPKPSGRPRSKQLLAVFKDIMESGEAFIDHPNTQGIRNGTRCSIIGLSLRDRNRQRRNAGAQSPEGNLREQFLVSDVSDDESAHSLENAPKSPVAYYSHSSDAEKVLLCWPTMGTPETIPTPIQTQPELRTFAKKHGFWCRFKKFMCALANNKLPSFPLAI